MFLRTVLYGYMIMVFLISFQTARPQSTSVSFDSADFFLKIKAITDFVEKSEYDEAYSAAQSVLKLTKGKKYFFGEAWSLIKLNDIAIIQENYQDVLKQTARILDIGKNLGKTQISGIGYLQIAQYYMYLSKQQEAEQYFEKALQFLPADYEYTALAWNDRGFNAGLLNDLTKEIEYYLKALRIYEKIHNKWGTAMVYSNLSALYSDLSKIDEAIGYAKKAIVIREELNDLRGLSFTYCNISQMYLNVNLTEAARYSVLCKNVSERLKDDGRLVHALNTVSLVKHKQGDNEEQIKTALEVLKILERKGTISISLARQYLSVGIIMSENRMDSAKAFQYFDKGLKIAIELNHKPTIRDAYVNITIFYKIRNDFYKAYENIKKYHSYKDSIINYNTQSDIAELQTKYETEKKDNEIAKLNTEQRLKVLAIQKQKAEIAGNRLLARQKEDEIFLLSKDRELLDLKVAQQNQILEKQLLLAQTQRQQLEIANKEKARQQQAKRAIIIGALLILTIGAILFNRYQLQKRLAENQRLLEVRDNIAKDLHDEVGSTLSSIKILSEVTQRNIGKDTSKSAALLRKIVEQSEQMQQGMSDIVWAIKPDNDTIEGISVRVREYINKLLEPKNIVTHLYTEEEVLGSNVGTEHRRDLLMICKEAINNIAKYSEATDVKIQIQQGQSRIRVEIEDNGRGFDTAIITSSNGLKNMKARTEKLKGVFEIKSVPTVGTTIKISIPLSKHRI